MKKNFWILFILPLMALTVSCNDISSEKIATGNDDIIQITPSNPVTSGDPADDGNNDGPEIAEENHCQGLPYGCINISVVSLSGLKFVEVIGLKEAHQAYAEKLGLETDEVKAIWDEQIGGLIPYTLHLNLSNLNKFFQFVRVSRSIKNPNDFTDEYTDYFKQKNEDAAWNNQIAQDIIDNHLDSLGITTLYDLRERVEFQRLQIAVVKKDIIDTAKIYGVHLVDELPDYFDNFAGPFASEVTDKIADALDNSSSATGKMYDINQQILLELQGLLESTSLRIKGTDQFVTFVTFRQFGEDEFAPNGEFLVGTRLYGAFKTEERHFIE